jgi:hypothetical protein
MRSNTLYLTGALAVLAIPLSAGAQPAPSTGPAQPDFQATTDVQQMTPGEDTCGPGLRWEEAGYAKHSQWRPAHCAPLEMEH